MVNTAQGAGFVQMSDCAPQTEMAERAKVPYKQFGRARDRKLVPFTLGIFNCLLGCIQIILCIVLVAFEVIVLDHPGMHGMEYPRIQRPVLFALRIGAGLGNFRNTLWSGILLLLAGIAGILTRTKSSTTTLLFSALTAFLAPLGCFGTIGHNFGLVIVDREKMSVTLSTLTLAAAGAGGSITQSVFSFRHLLHHFERKTDSVHQQQQRQVITRRHPASTTIARNAVTRQLKIALISLGISEIVCGLVIFAIQTVAAVEDIVSPLTENYLALPMYVPGILAGVILCISGSFGVMMSKRNFRGILNANLALGMSAAACSFTANFTATDLLILETDVFAGFSWPKPIIAFTAIAVVICIVHSSLCCKMQCQQEDEEILTVMTPSAHINDAYSIGSFSGMQSTSPYMTHDTAAETSISVSKTA